MHKTLDRGLRTPDLLCFRALECRRRRRHCLFDLVVSVRGAHERRLERAWRQVHAAIEHGVEESPVGFAVGGRRAGEIGDRIARKEKPQHAADAVDDDRHARLIGRRLQVRLQPCALRFEPLVQARLAQEPQFLGPLRENERHLLRGLWQLRQHLPPPQGRPSR